RTRERVGRAPECAIARPEAPDDRAGISDERRRVVGYRSVVHTRRGEPMAGGEEQREAATHAEADHPDRARAAVLFREPRAHRVDVVERASLPRREVAE